MKGEERYVKHNATSYECFAAEIWKLQQKTDFSNKLPAHFHKSVGNWGLLSFILNSGDFFVQIWAGRLRRRCSSTLFSPWGSYALGCLQICGKENGLLFKNLKNGGKEMESKARFLMMAMVCTAVLITCSSCANHNCSLMRFATEQAATADQELKEVIIEEINSSLGDTITTEVSWGGYTHSFLSERVEIEGRRVILYNVCGQIDADINWTIPMSADLMIIYPPIGTDCWVCMWVCINNKRCVLFPREVE